MKRISVLAMLLLGATFLNAQDALSIVTASRNRIKSETIRSVSRMVRTARNSTTEFTILQLSKDGPYGSRTVIVFRSPQNVAGAWFLNMDNASGGTDQHVYLPEEGRSRRISASRSGESFMGTDFSYDDISFIDRDASLDTHTVLREENFNGRQCYVIQSIPKDSSFKYSKMVSWIEKERYLSYKVELYNDKGVLVKVMEMSDFRDKQGRLTPMQTKISTVGAGTSTTIYLENIEYDSRIPDEVFDTRYLDTGRLR